MSTQQVLECMESSGTYDISVMDTYLAAGKSYAKWCKSNGYFPNAEYGILNASSLNVNPQNFMKERIFENEKSLIDTMKCMIPLNDGYLEVISCIFAWLGIPHALYVLESDVLLDKRIITCNGKIVSYGFSDSIYNILNSYANLRESTRENGTAIYSVIKDYTCNTFIKPFYSPNSDKFGKSLDDMTIQSAINRLNLKCKNAGNPPKFTYRNILKSGSLNRLYNAEINGLKVFDKDNEEIVKSYFYRPNYRSIIWLYRHYKQAFNL